MTFREILPSRRRSHTFTMSFGGMNTEFNITTGYYDDGRIGEVFIDGSKSGSEMYALAHDGAVLVSLALQHRVPLTTVQHALSRTGSDGKPGTIIGAVIDRIVKNGMERYDI